MGHERLKIEDVGAFRKQWFLICPGDTLKCLMCHKESYDGYYCAETERFWCTKCYKDNFMTKTCSISHFIPIGKKEGEHFKVNIRSEAEQEKKRELELRGVKT